MSVICGQRSVTLPVPQQKTFNGKVVPVVLVHDGNHKDVTATSQWVQDNESNLKEVLDQHGAIVFRGFPLSTAGLEEYFCTEPFQRTLILLWVPSKDGKNCLTMKAFLLLSESKLLAEFVLLMKGRKEDRYSSILPLQHR